VEEWNMNRSNVLVVLGLTLVAAPAADAAPPKTRSGTLLHEPLRVDVSWGGTYEEREINVYVRDVLRETPAGREVTVYIRHGHVIAVQAKTVADVALLDAPGLGAEVAARPRVNSKLAVIGKTADGAFYRVLTRRGKLYVAASMVEIGIRHHVGENAGNMLAPLFAYGTEIRDARFFHPDGHTFHATVQPLTPDQFQETARGLGGNALIRLGLGWNRLDGDGNAEPMVDILSLAIRIYDDRFEPSSEARPGDQDLLLSAGAKTLWDFPYQMFFSNTDDYLKNDYYPAMPYEVEGQNVELRVVPKNGAYVSLGTNRLERLHDAIDNGQAVYVLELRAEPERDWLGRATETPWVQLAEITFVEQVDVDQDALHYHPGMAGRGFQPTGWIAQARGAVYRASQDARSGGSVLSGLESTAD
jgi:hypothetical protein